jgi:hypothetical protein
MIKAVNWVPLTKLVGRSEPFQRTTAPETKPQPLTVRVNPGDPAVVTTGCKLIIVGVAVAVALKVVFTDRLLFIATVQVLPEVESQPLQPANTAPWAAVAVSVTDCPLRNWAEQTDVGQVIPP